MTIAMQATAYNNPQPSNPKERLRDVNLTESDRNYAVVMHLTPLVLTILGAGIFAVLGPLVLWMLRRNHSPFDDDHGREVLNFGISFFLWHIVTAITVIGLVLWPVLWIVAIVNNIRGAMAAGNGEYFRYPMTIRFLS